MKKHQFYRVTLKAITGEAIRGGTIKGVCTELPRIGKRFQVLGDPLSGGDLRLVTTSPIASITKGMGECEITTENNRYKVTIEEIL